MSDETLWSVKMASGQLDAIRALADERETVGLCDPTGMFYRAPLGSEILIHSSGVTGWMVCVGPSRVMGTADDLAALCRSLVAVGRKREREIAGRIKVRAMSHGAPAEDWAGEPPKPKPSAPRSIEDVARAWMDSRPMKAGNVSTDGLALYSWRLCIGRTVRGKKIVSDYRQQISVSTTYHVNIAMRFADRVETP